MAFKPSAESFLKERTHRQTLKGNLLRFGNSFADDSLLGIRPDDLVLVGAPSGVGKTQFCVNLAMANTDNGKRVHFFALEAGEFEIERRLKFQVLAANFYGDPNRPRIGRPLLFDEWEVGEYDEILEPYEKWAEEYCAKTFKHLHVFYKTDDFDAMRLIETFSMVADETDLVLVDHAHYFDWDDQNDNRALKQIAKTARDLCLTHSKPMVLVAHLRKRDRNARELVAGLDEFHGSSDLTKIATKVITLAPGGPASDGQYITYVRTPKNRHSSSSSRFLARMVFNEKKGSYEGEYKLGWANAEEFGEIEPARLPSWFGRSSKRRDGSNHHPSPERQSRPRWQQIGVKNYAPGASQD